MRAFITFSIFSFIALACIAYWLLNASNEPILLSPSEVTTFSSQPLQTSLLDIDSNDDGALPVKRSDQELNTKDSARAKERELLSSLPRSLRGTDVNGGFQVDEEGHLIIASSNRDFFEYFLSALGEESLEQVTDRMIELITLGLEPPAEGEAIALLHNYIAMKRAMQDLESQVGEGLSQYGQTSIDQHRARLDMVSAVRRQYLGDEAADAFYGESEGYDQYMMSKMAITSDKSLSDKQRAEAMVHLMEQAPQSVKPRLEDEYKMQRLRLEVATLKEDGAGEEAIYQARSEVLGEAAARRLQQVDQAQAQWNEKYQNYRDQREQLASDGLSDTAFNEELVRLQEMLFEPQEVRRVQALDRLNTDKK